MLIMKTVLHRSKIDNRSGAKLTPKRKAFIQAKIDNPTISNQDAVIRAGYNVSSKVSASNIGNDLMQQPVVQMALAQHNELLESSIIGTVRDWKDSDTPRKREIALTAAMFAYDHVHGKSTTRIESHVESFNVTIDLTGQGGTPPPDDEILDFTED